MLFLPGEGACPNRAGSLACGLLYLRDVGAFRKSTPGHPIALLSECELETFCEKFRQLKCDIERSKEKENKNLNRLAIKEMDQ